MVAGVLIASIVSLLWIPAQIAVSRRRSSGGRFREMCKGFVFSLPLVGFALGLLSLAPSMWTTLAGIEHPLGIAFHACFAHVLIFFLYVECFYHVERSVTLRLLIEILNSGNRQPTAAEIAEEYKVDDMIAQRLAVLAQNEYLSTADGRFQLLPKGRRFAGGVQLFCWIFQSKTQDERL